MPALGEHLRHRRTQSRRRARHQGHLPAQLRHGPTLPPDRARLPGLFVGLHVHVADAHRVPQSRAVVAPHAADAVAAPTAAHATHAAPARETADTRHAPGEQHRQNRHRATRDGGAARRGDRPRDRGAARGGDGSGDRGTSGGRDRPGDRGAARGGDRPDTATFPADEARRAGRRVFMFRGCRVAGRRTPGRANFGQPYRSVSGPGDNRSRPGIPEGDGNRHRDVDRRMRHGGGTGQGLVHPGLRRPTARAGDALSTTVRSGRNLQLEGLRGHIAGVG